jgi:N-acetylglucosamine-6-phosphate deacetylase
MSDDLALTGARIFDGEAWHAGRALLVANGRVEAMVATGDIPAGVPVQQLDGGALVPGFIDLQVNGGGGVQFNDQPTPEAIRTIAAAHMPFGTTAMLVTLITDTPEVTSRALAAGNAAWETGIPGFLGLHLEGPHLALARKGAHDPALIRPMQPADLARLTAARSTLPHLLTTVAAETVDPQQVAGLAGAGLVVSIGHSDASFALVEHAAEAGASMVTHLFNAMSQLGSREPGVVGAALALGRLSVGLIADGIHVHPESIGVAVRAKRGPGRIFLVTDAMAPTGTDMTSFTLNGRTIHRAGGALRLADGTLAGADLTMIDAVAFMHHRIGLPLEEALRMATVYPACVMGIEAAYGHLRPGARADICWLTDDLAVGASWIGGRPAYRC